MIIEMGLEKMIAAAGSYQRSSWRRLSVATLFVLAFSSSISEAATPTEVHNAVKKVIAKVRLLHDANFSNADAPSIQPEGRKPRHVLQLSRTVLDKANTLATINGGATVSVPPMPSREVKPDDVLDSVHATDRVIAGLMPIFGVEAAADAVMPAGKKTPNDVYASLHQLSTMIDGLGIPATVPNDVYRISKTITLELTDMVQRSGLSMPAPPEASAGKKPQEVYDRAFDLAAALRQMLLKRPNFEPAGGLTEPQSHAGPIKPEQVRYVLNDLLAEVASMEVAAGYQKKIMLASVASGMTPSDVYDELTKALSLVEAMTSNG